MSRYQARRAKAPTASRPRIRARKVKGRTHGSQAHRPLAVIMAVLMAFAMMLPANLATYAAGPDEVALQEQQAEGAPEQQAEGAQELQAPETSEDTPQPEQPATLTPLDEPALALAPTPEPEQAEPSLTTMDDDALAGEGTEASPYLITSVADLQWMRARISDSATTDTYRNKYYKLTADIDMTNVKDWVPIGTSSKPFQGNFDGNGKIVSNLSIAAATSNVGFFSYISGATIKDLALMNLEITLTVTAQNTGGIASSVPASSPASTISGCYVSGNITSNSGSAVGGILGWAQSVVIIENCRVDGTVKGSFNVGGILGRFNGVGAPTIRNCLVTASIEGNGLLSGGTGCLGGIFGVKDGASGAATVENCRVLSKSIFSKDGPPVGAIYGNATGNGVLTITNVSAWKGLTLDEIPLKDILYGDSLFSDEKNGATILSWKLALQEGWPAGLTSGAWSYQVGKMPVLTQFSAKMSNEFPEYMADYLTSPEPVNTVALATAIQEAKALQFSQYPDGWDDFQLTLTRIERVLNDDESSQAELDAAAKVLEDAFELLKSRNVLMLTGAGTEAEPYLIANAGQLQKMGRLINSADVLVRDAYRDKYYRLTADIDMEGVSWAPLGGTAAATAFTGTFDGNKKTISNLIVSGTTSVGFFGYISGATIKDLTLEDCEITNTSRSYTAALVATSTAGSSKSTITGCKVSGVVNGILYTAGIVAQVIGSITIQDCTVSGRILDALDGGSGGYVGGIIGRSDTSAGAIIVVENCTVAADIIGAGSYAAGIASYFAANNTVTIRNCDVILSDSGGVIANANAGGIAGNTSNNMTIENCSVVGGMVKDADTVVATPTGGVVGEIPNSAQVTLTGCYIQTNVESGNQFTGGLIGRFNSTSSGNLKITNCVFSGSVTGTDYVGGLMGFGTRFTITDCYVDGQVTGVANVGGILGYTNSSGGASIKDSYTLASVYGSSYVGGIFGQQPVGSTGTFSVVGCRALGQAVTRDSLSAAATVGALSGEASYNTGSYVQTDTFAWSGLMLGRNTLADTTPADSLFNANRNGQGFLSWALRSANGWPTALTDNDGSWSYSVGELPVLTKFANKLSGDFPLYMESIPDTGTIGNKTGLQASIATAAALESTDYSQESAMWAEFREKLTLAGQINELYDASQAVIDAAKVALTDAMTELNRLNNVTFVGDGKTEATAYEISSLDQLLKMNRVVNSPDLVVRNEYRAAYYKLTADINMAGVSWAPLGGNAAGTAFTGTFDGGGKTISNLKLSGETHLGFFGYVSGTASIKNLTLKDFSIEGTSNLGAVAAYSAVTTTITDCAVSGIITANGNYIGGITSYMQLGTISGCTAEVDILNASASGNYVGGIAGHIGSGSAVGSRIESCSVRSYHPDGVITNNNTGSNNGYTGGIVGSIDSGQNTVAIKDCSVQASIMGSNVGGIVGYATSYGTTADRIVISGCWFSGMLAPAKATSAANLGGIAGTMLNNFRITDCRSDGTITTAAVAGGILARFSGTLATDVNIANCYTTMRIGNGGIAGGLVGNSGATTGASKLVITDSFALNEQVSGETTAQAIHAFGEDNAKFNYTLTGVKAWNEMLIRVDGTTQAVPSGEGAVSYDDLKTAVGWPPAFQSAPWVYVVGKLPIFAGMSGMSADFPAWMTSPGGSRDIADTKALLALINGVDALLKTAYTAESWETLAEALSAAKALLRNDQATQAEVDAAAEALEVAIDGLELYKEVTTLAGEGSATSPFLIASAADYEEMSRLLDISITDFYRQAHYKLTNDIDLQGVTRSPMPYTTATSFSRAPAFAGDFDGGGFTISNLSVTHVDSAGMFGWTNGARIHDLNLANCAISGTRNQTGAIAGYAQDTVFENIRITGTVVGLYYLGGIVGYGSGSSTIKNCHFEGTVETTTKTSFYIGGLSGNFRGTIEDSSFKGHLTYNGSPSSSALMGGIVGAFTGEDIKGCYVDAEITYRYKTAGDFNNAGATVGGIVGTFGGKNILDCHFKGTIDVRGEDIGGIVGGFNGLTIQGCTSEGEIIMNYPFESGEYNPKPAGGIVGTIRVSGDGVLIDSVTSSMSIGGFRGTGGIAGVMVGGGTLTISNSYALNKELNNSWSAEFVDPLLFGEDFYSGFTGTFISENNYVWEGMLINGKTVAEWLGEYNEGKYGNGAGGVIIGPWPGDGGNPGQPGEPGDGDGTGGPGQPGDGSGGDGPGQPGGPSGPGVPGIDPSGPGFPSLPGDGSSSPGTVSADASGTGTGAVIDNRPPAVVQTQPPARDTVVEQPDTDTPSSSGTTGTEVSLTPIPLGLGFQTVANTVLTIAVGFVALGIFALGGFVFWRMYRRRIDVK